MERFELDTIQHCLILQEKQKSKAATDLHKVTEQDKDQNSKLWFNMGQFTKMSINFFFPSHCEAYLFIPCIFTSLLSCFGQCYIIKYDANIRLASISALGLAVLLLWEPREFWTNLYNNKKHASQLSLSPCNQLPNTSHINEHILEHPNTSHFSIYSQLIAHTSHVESKRCLTDQQKHELNAFSHTGYTAKAN